MPYRRRADSHLVSVRAREFQSARNITQRSTAGTVMGTYRSSTTPIRRRELDFEDTARGLRPKRLIHSLNLRSAYAFSPDISTGIAREPLYVVCLHAYFHAHYIRTLMSSGTQCERKATFVPQNTSCFPVSDSHLFHFLRFRARFNRSIQDNLK